MKPNFEIIDKYLNGELSNIQRSEIDRQLTTDALFAKDFALMLLAKKAAKKEADIQKKTEFEHLRSGLHLQKTKIVYLNRRAFISAAAACLALIIGFFWLLNKPENPELLADNYIKANLVTLPVLMGTEEDSLQKGINFYNKKAYLEASNIFEKLGDSDPKSIEYLGLTYLQLELYDKAIVAFNKLSVNINYKSRGKLLEALSYIKKGAKDKCYEILKEINKKDLSLEDREFVEDMAIRN